MPIGAQPRNAQGTVGHPYSALNLRLILATIGLLGFTALAVILGLHGLIFAAVVAGIVAGTAVVDIVVIQLRRRQRARDEGGDDHSIFE
jgi:uncharacterized membrane protein (DUF4010 family)